MVHSICILSLFGPSWSSSLVFICGFICSRHLESITCNSCTQKLGDCGTLLWEFVCGLILRTCSINIELSTEYYPSFMMRCCQRGYLVLKHIIHPTHSTHNLYQQESHHSPGGRTTVTSSPASSNTCRERSQSTPNKPELNRQDHNSPTVPS